MARDAFERVRLVGLRKDALAHQLFQYIPSYTKFTEFYVEITTYYTCWSAATSLAVSSLFNTLVSESIKSDFLIRMLFNMTQFCVIKAMIGIKGMSNMTNM